MKNVFNYDEKITLKAAAKVGCKHPINKISTNYRNCDNKDDIRNFNSELYDVDPTLKYLPPCRSLISLSEYQGEDVKECTSKCGKQGAFGLQIIFDDNIFRELIYSKVYSLKSLIGICGGYIGKHIKLSNYS